MQKSCPSLKETLPGSAFQAIYFKKFFISSSDLQMVYNCKIFGNCYINTATSRLPFQLHKPSENIGKHCDFFMFSGGGENIWLKSVKNRF